jgi:hypothetical protein
MKDTTCPTRPASSAPAAVLFAPLFRGTDRARCEEATRLTAEFASLLDAAEVACVASVRLIATVTETGRAA